MGNCFPEDDDDARIKIQNRTSQESETTKTLKQESESKTEPRKRGLSGGSFSYNKADLKDASIVQACLHSRLSDGKVSDLNLSNKVITLKSDTDSTEAVQTLLKNKIRAAPVVDAHNKFIGVLDLRDTLKYSLELYKNKSHSKSNESISSAFKLRTFHTVKKNDNLLTVAHILANEAHIVCVMDDNELIGVINQGELLQNACNLWDDPENNCSLQNLLALHVISSPVKSIKYNVSAFQAFTTMSDLGLSGLAVVDNDGIIIHNTSASDIKLWLLTTNTDDDDDDITLEEPIEEFLINIRKKPSLIEKYPITHCTLDQTFRRALSKLQATEYHRLWIVDKENHPIGVLAITDIFRWVSQT